VFSFLVAYLRTSGIYVEGRYRNDDPKVVKPISLYYMQYTFILQTKKEKEKKELIFEMLIS
jgi:hypothetical protein